MNNKTAIVPNTNGRYVAYDDGRIFDLKTNKFVAYHKSKRGWLKCHIWQNGIRKTNKRTSCYNDVVLWRV